jgi:hypothetical protein
MQEFGLFFGGKRAHRPGEIALVVHQMGETVLYQGVGNIFRRGSAAEYFADCVCLEHRVAAAIPFAQESLFLHVNHENIRVGKEIFICGMERNIRMFKEKKRVFCSGAGKKG